MATLAIPYLVLKMVLLRPPRLRNRDTLPIHVNRIHSFVVETEELDDRRTGGEWIAITPDDIFVDLLANPGGPVRCLTFIGAMAAGCGWLQELHTNILLRNIIAHRQAGLDQQMGMMRIGYGDPAEHD